MRNTILYLKSSLEGLTQAEEKIRKLKDRAFIINETEEEKVKRVKKNEESLRDLGDTIHWNNIYKWESQKVRNRGRIRETVWRKNGQRCSKSEERNRHTNLRSSINSNVYISKETYIKIYDHQTVKSHKSRGTLESRGRKVSVTYKGAPTRLVSRSLSRNLSDIESGMIY